MPKNRNLDLTTLSAGEKLWLWRVRKGWNQPSTAKRMRIKRIPLVQMELDRREIPVRIFRLMHQSEPIVFHEQLRLARRRSGMDLRRVAKGAGVSHMTVLKWERIGNRNLRLYWRGKGFTFG